MWVQIQGEELILESSEQCRLTTSCVKNVRDLLKRTMNTKKKKANITDDSLSTRMEFL